MEYIPDYLKPFIIHKDYFPELIENSWFNNPVYWKGRLISPQNETKFKLYFCGELIDNSICRQANFTFGNICGFSTFRRKDYSF